jgi:predicted AlkP superfamily phosphohydrolase/phosphomutase
MKPAPVVFLGFDAVEPLAVRQGIDEGWLPTLAGLLESGRYAVLDPVPSGFYNTSWASTVTGTDAGQHLGVLDRVIEPGTYRIVDQSMDDFRRPPFWRYLSDAGVRSTLASVYSARVIKPFLGTQVQGWGSIDPYTSKFGDTFFEPPEVEALLRDAVGRRQALYRVAMPNSDSQYRRYRDRLLRSVEEQTRGLEALIDGTDWDFFFSSYAEPHQSGHVLWHLHDPEHPDHDPTAAADLKDALRSIYRAVDAGLARLIERLPADARVFVLTPHGMAPFYVDDPAERLLELGGWLVRRPTMSTGGVRERSMRAVWSLGRRVVPVRSRLRSYVGRTRAGSDERATMPLSHVDWSQTKAFALPGDMTSYVRVNLAGREPEGIVRPGAEYDTLCDDLCVAFGAVTDAETGMPAAERVVRSDRVFGRPVEGSLPDVCVVWAGRRPLRRLHLPEHGTVEAPDDDLRTGQHAHLGFMLGAGPGIAPSGEAGRGTVLDVAPTALALLGVDQPADLPGRPISAFTQPAGHLQ